MTAKELLDRLSQDPAWANRREADAAGRRLRRAISLKAQEPLLADLARHGIHADSVSALNRAPPRQFRNALPVLLDWLDRSDSRAVRSAIIQALGRSEGRPSAARPLLAAFDAEEDDLVRWSIGSALAEVSDDSVAPELIDRVADTRYGDARQMLVIALGRLRHPEILPTLISLLEDPSVVGHAIMALGEIGVADVAPRIEPFTRDRRAWVRAEARKALRKFDRPPRLPSATSRRSPRTK